MSMCPFCGAPNVGGNFCAYCRAKLTDGGGAPAAPAREGDLPFTWDISDIFTPIDPQLGPIALGGFAPGGRPAVLRAWDMRAEKELWSALQGEKFLDTGTAMAVRARNVYIANKRQLFCLDLATGQRKWATALSDKPVEADGVLMIGDPFPPGQRGAILVPTIDNCLTAFDRDSGQQIWNRAAGERRLSVQTVPGMCTCVVLHEGAYVKADIVNPAYPAPIARLGNDHWSTDLGKCVVQGRSVVTVAEDLGSEGDDDGFLGFDAVTGQIMFFDQVEDLDEDVIPCAVGPRAFAVMDNGGLYVGPRGRVMPPPVPNHKIMAMKQAGPTLVFVLTKAQGSAIRRIVGIDPQTLAFRFDAGEAGDEPDGDWDAQLATDGYSVVYVAIDDDGNAELRSIDTTSGRRLWSRKIVDNRYESHFFRNGALVVRSSRKIEVLSPQNGQPIASLG
jgi:outer membrane protein assembly factor BamB